MSLPPTIIPAPRRVRRKRRLAPTAPAGLTLVAASYQFKEWVRLSFDRAIDITAIDPAQVFVNDGPGGSQWQGTGAATLIDPVTVLIAIHDIGRFVGADVFLNASDATGIVAADDPELTWAGADGVVLPFG